MNFVRIVCLSDTHSQHEKIIVPAGDIVVHAGDATYNGYEREVTSFGRWYASLPHKRKIFVAGNHDRSFENTPDQAISWLYKGDIHHDIIYLKDEATEMVVNGIPVKIYGSPWQPEFCNWAFNLRRGKPLKDKWNLIHDDADIVITHGPPFGIGDSVNRNGESVGCQDLKAAIERIKPKAHVFGHIHEGYGTEEIDDTLFINTSICTDMYQPTNPPIVFDLYEDRSICLVLSPI